MMVCGLIKNHTMKKSNYRIMKTYQLFFLGVVSTFLFGCSSNQRTEIEYFDCETGQLIDEKSDCIRSIKNEVLIKKGQYTNYLVDKWERDGLNITYLSPGVVEDSIIYRLGEVVEHYSFYPNGQLKDVWINEVVECGDLSTVTEGTSVKKDKTKYLYSFPLKIESYYENGQISNRYTYSFKNSQYCGEIESYEKLQESWYKNGNKQRILKCIRGSKKRLGEFYGNVIESDEWNEDGTWESGSFFNKDGEYLKSKKSFEDTNNPYSY